MDNEGQDLANRLILFEANRLLDRGRSGLVHIGKSEDLSMDDDIGYCNATLKGVIVDLQSAIHHLNHMYIKQKKGVEA